MNTPRNAHWSSAEVIQFPEIEPPTFLERRDPWQDIIIGHPEATHADKVVGMAISRKFNSKYYAATGELFAFPGWDYLKAATGGKLSKATISKSIGRWETLGLLFVEHGRRRCQRRDGNKYFARNPQGQNSGPWPWPQGVNLTGRDLALEEKLMSQGSIPERSGIEQKEKRVKKRDESLRVESKKEGSQGLNSKPRDFNFSDSDSDSKKESRTPEQAALRPEAGKAVNGSSSSVAQYLRKRQREEAAARTAAERKSYPRVEASDELTRQIHQRGRE